MGSSHVAVENRCNAREANSGPLSIPQHPCEWPAVNVAFSLVTVPSGATALSQLGAACARCPVRNAASISPLFIVLARPETGPEVALVSSFTDMSRSRRKGLRDQRIQELRQLSRQATGNLAVVEVERTLGMFQLARFGVAGLARTPPVSIPIVTSESS